MTTSGSERPIDEPIGPPDGEQGTATPAEHPAEHSAVRREPAGPTAHAVGRAGPAGPAGTARQDAAARNAAGGPGRGVPHRQPECTGRAGRLGRMGRMGRVLPGSRGARGALSAARAACGAPARATRRGAPGARDDRRAGTAGHGEAQPGRGAARGGHGAMRAGRLRREPLRRLLPQALVVACLAGGTTAFVADDKSVQLSIDGKPRILHTFADDVAELLDDEGVVVGTRDAVTPTPGTPLTNGATVRVRHARPLRLTVDGRRRHVWTTAHTVDGALRVLGVRPEGAYLSVARTRHIARTGLTLNVRTERTVHVRADGRTRTVHTTAARAADAVHEAGVRLHGRDTLSVPAGSFPRDGQTIAVTRIRIGRQVRSETIPYPVHRTHDPGLPRGTEVVTRHGRPGTRRITYATRTVDGVPRTPRRLAAEVVRRPRPEQVRVGTKATSAPAGGGHGGAGSGHEHGGGHIVPGVSARVDGLDWAALARCESGGRADAVDPSGRYGGLYQFDRRTWRSLGGHGRPQDAPAAEQTRLAKLLYARRGSAPWPVCGRHLTK